MEAAGPVTAHIRSRAHSGMDAPFFTKISFFDYPDPCEIGTKDIDKSIGYDFNFLIKTFCTDQLMFQSTQFFSIGPDFLPFADVAHKYEGTIVSFIENRYG
jgi:hypothetical protein